LGLCNSTSTYSNNFWYTALNLFKVKKKKNLHHEMF
jgi:hypothetical protein